ncbi:MAG: ABC transporter ATP-binding protein [Candidatus Zixiibacteriota bacterium]
MITVDHLTKEYRMGAEVVSALDDVSFHVQSGDFVTVAGPSGSGKSTLLMSLGGLIRPTRGSVQIANVDLYAQSPGELAEFRRKTIGFVFQQFHLVPYLTAWENVSLALMLNGLPPKHHRRKSMELLERFDLGSRAMHKPNQLSVGQQQRVAMARTLANDPDVILADEPTASLDPTLAESLIANLKELNRQGKTIILVTHSSELADTGSIRFTLKEGRLSRSATPEMA